MKVQQKKFSHSKDWEIIRNDVSDPEKNCNLVLAFGSTDFFSNPAVYASLVSDYPAAEILLNSTAGEICDTQVADDPISVTAIHFEKTIIKTTCVQTQ